MMIHDQDSAELPRGRMIAVSSSRDVEAYKPNKVSTRRSLFRRRNKRQSSKRRDLVNGSLDDVLFSQTPLLGHSSSDDELQLSEDDNSNEFAIWDAASATSDITGSNDGSLRSERSAFSTNSSSQPSKSPGRLFDRSSSKKKKGKKKKSRNKSKSKPEKELPSSIRSERSYQDCSSLDASMVSCKSEELMTISETFTAPVMLEPIEAVPTPEEEEEEPRKTRKKSRRRSSLASALFGSSDKESVEYASITPNQKVEEMSTKSISRTTVRRRSSGGGASINSTSSSRRDSLKSRKSTGALGSYLERPEAKERHLSSRHDIMDSAASSKASRKDKGYIISFLGSGNKGNDGEHNDEAPSLVASSTTGTTKSKEEHEELDNLDDESHASTIISRGLGYLEKFYEECT